jgi:hypothetical protein
LQHQLEQCENELPPVTQENAEMAETCSFQDEPGQSGVKNELPDR